jgi:hypothetical protein
MLIKTIELLFVIFLLVSCKEKKLNVLLSSEKRRFPGVILKKLYVRNLRARWIHFNSVLFDFENDLVNNFRHYKSDFQYYRKLAIVA